MVKLRNKVTVQFFSVFFLGILSLICLTLFISCSSFKTDGEPGRIGLAAKAVPLRVLDTNSLSHLLNKRLGGFGDVEIEKRDDKTYNVDIFFDLSIRSSSSEEVTIPDSDEKVEKITNYYGGFLGLWVREREPYSYGGNNNSSFEWKRYDIYTGFQIRNGKNDYRYNYWFSGNTQFNAYFEAERGAVFIHMELDRSKGDGDSDQIHYLKTASGTVYFKKWGWKGKQGPGDPPKPEHCLNILKGPYQCNAGSEIRDPRSYNFQDATGTTRYRKLGTFKNVPVTEIFGIEFSTFLW